MLCRTLLYVHSSVAIILIGKREPVALLCLSSWCLVMVVWLFLAVPWVCLRFVIVAFRGQTHLLFSYCLALMVRFGFWDFKVFDINCWYAPFYYLVQEC